MFYSFNGCCVIATWVIPAGAYSKLSYEPSSPRTKDS